jgi:hypothetical protein
MYEGGKMKPVKIVPKKGKGREIKERCKEDGLDMKHI